MRSHGNFCRKCEQNCNWIKMRRNIDSGKWRQFKIMRNAKYTISTQLNVKKADFDWILPTKFLAKRQLYLIRRNEHIWLCIVSKRNTFHKGFINSFILFAFFLVMNTISINKTHTCWRMIEIDIRKYHKIISIDRSFMQIKLYFKQNLKNGFNIQYSIQRQCRIEFEPPNSLWNKQFFLITQPPTNNFLEYLIYPTLFYENRII